MGRGEEIIFQKYNKFKDAKYIKIMSGGMLYIANVLKVLSFEIDENQPIKNQSFSIKTKEQFSLNIGEKSQYNTFSLGIYNSSIIRFAAFGSKVSEISKKEYDFLTGEFYKAENELKSITF